MKILKSRNNKFKNKKKGKYKEKKDKKGFTKK
jgi:hypothetical protein